MLAVGEGAEEAVGSETRGEGELKLVDDSGEGRWRSLVWILYGDKE
jgi:hypothetical protein